MCRAAKQETAIRQRQLAEAALALLDEQGVEGMQIGAVAERVGLVPSAVYRHFSGRAALLEAVYQLIRERMLELVDSCRTDASAPLEQLKLLFERHSRLLTHHKGTPYLVFSNALQHEGDACGTLLHTVMSTYLTEVAAIIAAAQETGSIRPSIVPQTAAILFLGMIMPLCILNHLTGAGYDIDTHIAAAWPQFLHGIT